MNNEEREAIERIEDFLTTNIIVSISNNETANSEELKVFISKNEYLAIEFIASMFLKQSKEIEHQKEKRENQKKELAILNAKQIEFNKLVNTVNSYKGQFKRQQKEIEELKDNNKQKYYHVVKSKELEEEINNAWENKIKAKIEELDKQEKEVLKGTKGQDRYSIKQEYMHKRSVLQSLLEKE